MPTTAWQCRMYLLVTELLSWKPLSSSLFPSLTVPLVSSFLLHHSETQMRNFLPTFLLLTAEETFLKLWQILVSHLNSFSLEKPILLHSTFEGSQSSLVFRLQPSIIIKCSACLRLFDILCHTLCILGPEERKSFIPEALSTLMGVRSFSLVNCSSLFWQT